MGWKYAYASVAGTRHKKVGTPCQDFCDVRIVYSRSGEGILVAVVSDGAGSAKYSEIGAKLVCSVIMEEVKGFLENGNEVFSLNLGIAEGILIDFQKEVQKHADVSGHALKEYACTAITAVIGYKNAVFFQIGDGAAVISKVGEDGYTPVFWPGKGEYENSTYFAVDHESVVRHMKYGLVEGTVDKTALFTDGLERLALHYRSRSAFRPFFEPLFDNVKTQEDGCCNESLDSIASFLDSKKVNGRTDDDKTLIIASRCD